MESDCDPDVFSLILSTKKENTGLELKNVWREKFRVAGLEIGNVYYFLLPGCIVTGDDLHV